MNIANEFDSFSVCFNIMKLKYAHYDQTLDELEFLCPGDKINVFINFESVLKSMSGIKDVDRKVFNTKDFAELIISNIVNLTAHYRKFFRASGLDTKIYLYMTDLTSEKFNENTYNSDFRSYYLVKYVKNPKYSYMGEKLINEIIPEVKEIINCIPGIYFITGKDVEGSVIPLVIADKDPSRKNLIVTSDYIDTQLSVYPNFICHYIRRSPVTSSISYDLKSHLSSLLKKGEGKDYDLEINFYSNRSFYTLLFAMIGETYRSVEGIDNVGNHTLLRYLEDGLKQQKITPNTMNINSILDIFPTNIQDTVNDNFRCLHLESMQDKLTREQIYGIESQIIDRFDHNSLLMLNAKRFYNHRFMLEELTM